MNNNYILRLEEMKDYREVENLTREAFWNVYRPGCSEHYVLHAYRDRTDFVPELDFCLEIEDKIIAHIMYIKASISIDDGRIIPIMIFGPVSVLPDYQGKGYGSIIIKHSLQKAKEMGCGAVAITGNPEYYKRFGFVSGKSKGVYYAEMPREEDAPFFMVKELDEGFLDGVVGTYKDPEGYFVDDAEVEEFDKQFPPKEKKVLPGQLG